MFKKIIAAISAGIVIFAVANYFVSSGKKTNQELVQLLADTHNKDAPKTINNIRVDKATVKKNEIVYNFTYLNAAPGDVKKEDLYSAVYPYLVKNGCSNDKMVVAINIGILISYSYHDNQGNEILNVQLNKTVCSEK